MRLIFIGLILTSSLPVWAADKGQPVNVKTGLWEMTMTTTTSGTMPISPEFAAKLTPEQRAKMEAAMKANSGEKTRTITYKDCMTKEKLQKGADFGKTDPKCPPTVATSTASSIDVRFSCEQAGVKTSGTIHFDALNPENIRGSGQTSATSGGNTMNAKMGWTGKWIAAACGGETE
jgi:hypothetical protein